ncbi:MAG TPA: DMT family transporter [Gammaproteobacteria bacterium]
MNRTPLIAHLLLGIAALTWAGNFIVGRYIHDQVTPVTLNFGRWGLALLILLPFTYRSVVRQLPLILRHWRLLALLGLLGIAVFHTITYAALASTGAINAALILSLTPVVIVGLSWLLDREIVSAWQFGGILISLAGAVALITRGDISVIRTMDFNRGDIYMLIAMPNWALYSVLLRRRPYNVEPTVLLTVTIAAGVFFMTPLLVIELLRGTSFRVNVETTLSVTYVAVFASVIAYFCWNRGVEIVGANRAGLFMHLVPAFGALLAILILGESFAGYHVAGIVLIVTGIYLTTSAGGRKGARA